MQDPLRHYLLLTSSREQAISSCSVQVNRGESWKQEAKEMRYEDEGVFLSVLLQTHKGSKRRRARDERF